MQRQDLEGLDEPLLNQVAIPISAPTRSSGSSRGIYRAFENRERLNTNKKLLTKFSKKRNRERIYKFIVKSRYYLYVAVPVIIGGGSGVLQYLFGNFQNDKLLADLTTLRDLILSNYNKTQCPGNEYWDHPEQYVNCYAGREGWMPESGKLLEMDNYCIIPNCHLSNFVSDLIKHLPIACIPIMEIFCEVVIKIYDCKDKKVQEMVEAIAIPLFFTIFSLWLVSRAVKKASKVTEEEKADVTQQLEGFDVPIPEGPLQLEYVVSHLNTMDERAKKYDAVLNTLNELFISYGKESREGIIAIILQYAQLMPSVDLKTRHAISRRMIFDEDKADENEDKTDENRTSLLDDNKKLTLSTLFARIPKEQVMLHNKPIGLSRSDVADKIFSFAGLSGPA